MKRTGLICLALLLALGAGLRDAADRWIDATVLPVLDSEMSFEVRDRKGDLLRAFTTSDGRWRLATAPERVDDDFLDMLIAYEDKRFWRHSGVDPFAMLRAVSQAVWNGDIVSGGSTLTMQVARLLENSGTGRIKGKLRQMRLALALERHLSKEQILALYLDRAPYGGNLEGVRAATLAWFGREPARLTPAQSALLVALPQSPLARRPDRAPVAARTARDRVLQRMVGAGVLSRDTASVATSEHIPTQRRAFPAIAPHLSDRMRNEHPLAGRIATTIDRDLQRALENLAQRAAQKFGPQVSVAIMLADHGTGEVLASVGSAGYLDADRRGWIDMTRAARSPGSTLKPLIYGLAFDQGLAHPETLIDDRPMAFGAYAPVNFDGLFRGTLRLREALQMSLNVPVVALTEAIGPTHLMTAFRRSGARPELNGGAPGLAVALGGLGTTMQDLIKLYGAIANGGLAIPLHDVQGAAAQSISGTRVLSPAAAWQVGHILSGIAPPATAPRWHLAYKTGTSYGHRDAWAVGYDGTHVAAVWIGRPDGTPVPGAFGGETAAPVLFEAFSRLKPHPDPLPPPPPGVLMVANADLPAPLKKFRSRAAAFNTAGADAPKLAFPPDGAEVEGRDGLLLRVRDGSPPFTWLANGAPVVVATQQRESIIVPAGAGILRLAVIDAAGRSAQAEITLR